MREGSMVQFLHGLIFREVRSSAGKSNFKMMQVLYRHCLGTEKRICSNTYYNSSSSPTHFSHTPQNNFSHQPVQLSFLLCFPSSCLLSSSLSSPLTAPSQVEKPLELSSTSFIPLIILPTSHSPYPAFPKSL